MNICVKRNEKLLTLGYQFMYTVQQNRWMCVVGGDSLSWYQMQNSISQNAPTYTLLTMSLKIQNWHMKSFRLKLDLNKINKENKSGLITGDTRIYSHRINSNYFVLDFLDGVRSYNDCTNPRMTDYTATAIDHTFINNKLVTKSSDMSVGII